jgi:hypothetical protein
VSRFAFWSSLYSLGTNHTENVFSIIACSFIAEVTARPQSCSQVTTVVLSPVYTVVTWQWVWCQNFSVIPRWGTLAIKVNFYGAEFDSLQV